jgi:aldose 1-epimerase
MASGKSVSRRAGAPGIQRCAFGPIVDGREASLFVLRNASGIEATISDLGASLISLQVPDRDGRRADVVLGYQDPERYRTNPCFFGVTVGRCANRIAGARFELDGTTYRLAANDGPNHLHGGVRGFDKRLWSAQPHATQPRLTLRYRSADGEEGYPGNLDVEVVYSLTAADELMIDYVATADRACPVNLTHHSYFNLAGGGDILSHELRLEASHFTPIGEGCIPTGEVRPVAGTPFDFVRPATIGSRIDAHDDQLRAGKGYDHNVVLHGEPGTLRVAVELYDRRSGRALQVLTTQPGLQLYTGNYLDGSVAGKGGVAYGKHAGLCLETQHFPDSPNRPAFPSVILRPGQRYRHTAIYRFKAL